MVSRHIKQDLLGKLACGAFLVSAALFWYVKEHVLFMYPEWDMAFGGTAFLGFVLGVIGIIRSARTKIIPILSILGVLLNIAPAGFMILVFGLGSMP